MIFINIKTKLLQFKFFYEERSLELRLVILKKTLLDIEYQFVERFKCSSCGTKCEREESNLKLCEECLETFMEHWKKFLR